jgi:hypothetical protein
MANLPPTDAFPYPQLQVTDIGKPFEIAAYLESRGVPYVFGGKDSAVLNGQVDDLDSITGLDCSGFAGVCLYHMTDGAVRLEDQNSQSQGEWAASQGYKESDPSSATNTNGDLYMFMLPSGSSPDGIGHVGFVRNSMTAESYGGHGPGSRPWGLSEEDGSSNPSWGWQSKCKIWVLCLSTDAGSGPPGR